MKLPCRRMQDSEVIKLVKPVPSDKLAIQVLVMWYNAVRPKWKKPLDLTITGFFVLMTLYSSAASVRVVFPGRGPGGDHSVLVLRPLSGEGRTDRQQEGAAVLSGKRLRFP